MLVLASLGFSDRTAQAQQGLAGSYLAALAADYRGDFAAGSKYLNRVLARDPSNAALLDRTLFFNLASGDISSAVTIAGQLEQVSPRSSRFAALTLAVEGFKKGEFRALKGLLGGSGPSSFPPLVEDVLNGWMLVEDGDMEAALALFDDDGQTGGRATFNLYNKAMALAIVGNFEAANKILEGGAAGPLRVNLDTIYFHADVLTQLDRREDATRLLGALVANGGRDSKASAMIARLNSGEELPFSFVTTPQDAVAENLRSLAQSLGQPDTMRAALIYARLASYLNASHVQGRLLTASILEDLEQYQLAIAIYDNVPRDADEALDASIGRAAALRADDQTDAAIEALRAVVRGAPEFLEGHLALGDALRSDEEFEECIDAYTSALALVETPTTGHWPLFYSRGICHERAKIWPSAEADFRQALELQPDQPLVLNYLGYSLIEKREKMVEAEDMIRKAVAARPDDAYITDSLGWVLYLTERYEEAVVPMERAAELLPIDPIINDHLGDVLWKVGRQTEATFHWKRALSFDPEEKEAIRIRRKLEIGLDAVLEEEKDG